ncbi:hypothetical protein HPB49_009937 [Dermacentor silvarum]|uniref:Uncharacterized protein n=1 Tax=Dermacentor silvarum TaxID=543639 RepID=A0ACB8DIK1_DERSI|nr:hypothetical protein HPB49_009937 [Dermacentor silvarum]
MEGNHDVRESGAHDEQSGDDRCSVYGDVMVAIAIAVTVGVLLGSLALRSKARSMEQRLTHETGASSFCCPDKVRELVPYLNSSLEPCDNFFDYACSSAVRSRLMMNATVDSRLERFVVTGVPPEHRGRGGEVAEFMIGYFRSCVASIGRRDEFASQMAQSILRVAQDALRHPNSRNSLQFMVEVSVRYMIPSVLEVTYHPRQSRLRFRLRALCKVAPFSADCLNASVNAVRSAISPLVTTSNTEKFMAELCQHFPATLQNRTYAWANATEAISRQLWRARDIRAAMSAVGWTVSNATVVDVMGLLQVRAIHDAFALERDCGPKAAYLLWHSVFAAALMFLPGAKPSYMAGFEHCMRKARHNGGDLWRRLRDEVISQRGMDDHVTTTFTAVKQAVLRYAESSSLFDADLARLRSLVGGLAIVTATTDVPARHPVQVPRAVGVFAENVLRMNDYVHALSHAGGGHHVEPLFLFEDVKITDDREVQISPRLYDVVESASPHSDMLNMATLGYDLAEAVWNLLLLDERWNQSTVSILQQLLTCFQKSYAVFGQQRGGGADVIAPSLGLASVLSAFSRPADWHTRKLAWSTSYMSHAQLFYLLAATRRCPVVPRTLTDELRVVMPFMYVLDFARAFNCARGSVMGTPVPCQIVAQNV